MDNANKIQFLLNGKLITARGIESTKSVLNFLRTNMLLIGSKEGCAEGDCGACTVVVAELVNDKLAMRAVNACIQFVPTLNGKALFTVEYLRQQSGELHPVQKAMVDLNGSQCGFCTPGFIMSLWNVYVDHQANNSVANDEQIRTALSGNLCRCTGYKPIIEAGKQMFDLPKVDFQYDFIVNQLIELRDDEVFSYHFETSEYYAPKSWSQFTSIRRDNPNATILAGCTDIGLWVNKQFRELGDIIYIGNIEQMKSIELIDDHLHIGAVVSLNDAFQAIAQYFPQITQQWERFASVPIRNAGTLGGNVANGSPIGDSMPWLITLSAKVEVANGQGSRVMPLEDLYLDYMKKSMYADEIVKTVIVPINQPEIQFRTYKLSKRYDSDISAVCAAFAITFNGEAVSSVKIAFGGMAATPKRANQTEDAIVDQNWTQETVQYAMSVLAQDYSPLSDMRASDKNRLQSAQNLLYRFYLETRLDNPLKSNQVNVFEAA